MNNRILFIGIVTLVVVLLLSGFVLYNRERYSTREDTVPNRGYYQFKTKLPDGNYEYTPYENDHPLILPPNPSRPDWFNPLTNTRAPVDLSPHESGSWLSASVFKGRRPYKNPGIGYTDERGWIY